jgi:hypothetical protein
MKNFVILKIDCILFILYYVKFETQVKHISQIYVVKVIIDDEVYVKRLYID